MIRNLGKVDQYVRIVVGLAMIAFVFKDAPINPGWPILLPVGAILIATAVFSFCPLYTVFGWNTAKKPTRAS
jgi:hypothetical protein